MSTEKSEKYDGIVASSASIGGAIAGGMMGLTGGPTGVFAGVIVGAMAETLFKKAGKEIKERVLSKSEENKITTVYDLAKEKIGKRLDEGEIIRDDGFFDTDGTTRSKADEVFEDLMFAAQREAEEKKLHYMANLFCNIAFDKSISKEEAHQLIKVAESLSYRQFVIINLVAFLDAARADFVRFNLTEDSPREGQYGRVDGYEHISILTETLELYRKSIIHSKSVIFDIPSMDPSKLSVVGIGAKLYNLMELCNFPRDEICIAVQRTLAIKP